MRDKNVIGNISIWTEEDRYAVLHKSVFRKQAVAGTQVESAVATHSKELAWLLSSSWIEIRQNIFFTKTFLP